MNEEVKENKMGTMPVGKLMLNMGIPMILSMMLQAVYNIVDSYFVSNMPDTANLAGAGEKAVNALTLAFPIQMLIVAAAIGTGVGVNVLLSLYSGQGNKERAGLTAGNAYILGGIIFLVCLLFGIFGTHAYISSQTTDTAVIEMGEEYLKICCILSFGMVYFALFEKILQSTGRTQFSTIAQVAGAVTNIVLDPILIYGWCKIPALGVRGAAYATVIGQVVSFVLALLFHIRLDKEIPFRMEYLKIKSDVVKSIYSIGFPAIVAQAVMSVMTYGINLIFGMISSSYVTAYGIFYKIQQFVLFAAFGLRDAITPIISFNYGKKDKERIRDGIKFGMIYTLIIMLVCFLILEILASPIAGAFSLSAETEKLCITAMRVVSVSFLFAGANIAFQGIFQALSCGTETLVLSLLRQLIFVLPAAWILARTASNLVWFAFVFAEAAAFLAAVFMFLRVWKKKLALQK